MIRFGIMEMQLDRLLPKAMTPKDAAENMLQFDHGKLITGLVQEGFQLIELCGDLGLYFPNAYDSKSIQRLANLKREMGITYTVHLPLGSVEPSTPLESVRLGSVDAILDLIDALEPLNPEVYVLHGTGALAAEFYRKDLPKSAKSLVLKRFQGGAINSIQIILEETNIPSRKLAIETVGFPLDLTIEIAELLDLSICLDTGHILAGFSGPIRLDEALQTCLARLAEIHLHDSPDFLRTGQLGFGKDHQALGSGDLDIKFLINTLKKHNFAGPIIFELSVREALRSLAVLRELGGIV